MKKELRRQIKQDEFVSTLGLAAGWLRAHAQEVRVVGMVVVVLALGAGALNYFRDRRAREADKAMTAALEAFQAPVAAELPEGFEQPPGPVFQNEREKYEKAAAAFEGIERRYGSQPAGRRARYYSALCRAALGDAEGADKVLNALATSGPEGALEPALARLAVADLKRRAGKVDEAVDAYRRLADDRSLVIPREHALMSLASTLEEAHRTAEARTAYRRLADEFPGSVYAAEARRRADYLGAEARS